VHTISYRFEICRFVKSFTSRKEASFVPSLLNLTAGKFKVGKKLYVPG
jgi:hypothetical protein